ncbi:MAG: single-stranded DNA-binding protein [Chlamydiales bacterium]|nr:single-stranded DNA-binding protein [Chlamydiia bacterium]MCP5507173.1 single-stranded DNA-binding protein [Chlamydiales bacterium]
MILLQIAGHLGADPEERFTTGGQKLWQLRVATNVRNKGEDTTIWWRVTVWGDQFDKMMPYFKKGSGIMVFGEMGKLDVYTDKSGQPQVSYDMTARMLYFPPFRSGQQDGSQQQQQGRSQGGMTSGTAEMTPADPQMAYSPAGESEQDQFNDDPMPF